MDYDETFCPVVRQESLRMLIALSVQQDLKLQLVDVTTAFLNGSLEEEVFMRQPEGFEVRKPSVQTQEEYLRTKTITSLLECST